MIVGLPLTPNEVASQQASAHSPLGAGHMRTTASWGAEGSRRRWAIVRVTASNRFTALPGARTFGGTFQSAGERTHDQRSGFRSRPRMRSVEVT
jgi:hypothetical protein